MATAVLALDHQGFLAVNDGIVFYLTECCQASGKGSTVSETGVCCRSCYQSVPAFLGSAWLASDAAAWEQWGAEFTAWAVKANSVNATSGVLPDLIEKVQAKAQKEAS